MYTYCDKGGATAAVVLGYYEEGGGFSGEFARRAGGRF